jgi:hypothetical protein
MECGTPKGKIFNKGIREDKTLKAKFSTKEEDRVKMARERR